MDWSFCQFATLLCGFPCDFASVYISMNLSKISMTIFTEGLHKESDLNMKSLSELESI